MLRGSGKLARLVAAAAALAACAPTYRTGALPRTQSRRHRPRLGATHSRLGRTGRHRRHIGLRSDLPGRPRHPLPGLAGRRPRRPGSAGCAADRRRRSTSASAGFLPSSTSTSGDGHAGRPVVTAPAGGLKSRRASAPSVATIHTFSKRAIHVSAAECWSPRRLLSVLSRRRATVGRAGLRRGSRASFACLVAVA